MLIAFAIAIHFLKDLANDTLVLLFASVITLLAYFYETFLVFPLISGILVMIPGIGEFFLAEPEILYIRISSFAFLFLFFAEFIARRNGIRILTSITLPFIIFFFFLFLRTLFEIKDFSLTGTDKTRFVGLFQLINGPIFLFISGFLLQLFPGRSKRFFFMLWVGYLIVCVSLFITNYDAIRMGSVRSLLVADDGQNYDAIGIGRILGAGTIISIIYFQHARKYLHKTITAIVCVSFLSIMLFANEKGPVVFLLMVIIIILLVHRVEIKKQIWVWLSVLLFLFVGLNIGFNHMDPTHNRFLIIISTGISQEPRWALFAKAFNVFFDNVFVGSGYGGYNLATGAGYPHNIFLECLTESGVIGLMVFIYWLRNIFCTIFIMYRESLQLTISTYLFIYFLLNAQVSGSFAGNAPLFLFAGIIAAREALQRNGLTYDKKV